MEKLIEITEAYKRERQKTRYSTAPLFGLIAVLGIGGYILSITNSVFVAFIMGALSAYLFIQLRKTAKAEEALANKYARKLGLKSEEEVRAVITLLYNAGGE